MFEWMKKDVIVFVCVMWIDGIVEERIQKQKLMFKRRNDLSYIFC